MSEILWGVIIGGVIASIVPVVSLFYSHRKWKVEKKIENLRIKRDRLEKLFEEAREKISDGLEKNFYSMDMITNFELIFPREVFNYFKNMMEDKDENKRKTEHFYLIMKSMKKCLADIDNEIEKVFQ